MRSIRTTAAVWVLLVSVASAADYMPLKEGNQWTYTMSNGMQMTTRIVGFENVGAVRCAIAETGMGFQTTREYLAVDAQGVKTYMAQMQGQDLRYDPPLVRIKLPYRQGDAWQSTVNQFGMSMTTSFQSTGPERVQTPAGSFDCIKVQSSMTMSGQGPMNSTTWYADGVGPVRQVMVMAGQEMTVTLAATNVKPAPKPQAQPAPTVQTPAQDRCPKCGAKLPAGAKFCPDCGEKIGAPAAAATAQPATTDGQAPASNQPAMEKYQSPNGKVLLYKPAGWAVNEGEMFGPGIYSVTVSEPKDDAAVLFMTFPVDATIKDSVALAAKCTGALKQQFPDLKVANMNSTAQRERTVADLTLTAEGEKGTGHAYFFRTESAATVYFLLAKTTLWNEFRPTLTAIAANLAYAPQGVSAVQEQGRRLAEQAPASQAPRANLSPAAMLQDALKRPGRQLPLVPASLTDQSLSIQIPQGWSLTGGKIQYVAQSSPETKTHGMGYVSHTIIPMDIPVPNAITASYQPPAQALQTVFEFGKFGTDMQVLAETPAETAVPALQDTIQQQRAQGFQVDARLLHVRFRNMITGNSTRGLFIVQCSTRSMTPVWQVSINGSWAPEAEFDEYLPLYLRMDKTAKINEQWLGQELQNRAVAQQQQFRKLQGAIAESNKAFDGYMDSLRDADRSRDYTSHMWSQTTLGQGSWVAENEGAKVYHTDSWGIEGPEGRIDAPAYNTTNFTGQNPWTGRDMEMIDTRAEYERYIANQR